MARVSSTPNGISSSATNSAPIVPRYTYYDNTSYKELSMKKTRTKQGHYHSLKHASRLENTHHFATLMSPAEVDEATQERPFEVKARTKGHWVLCGDVSSEMFQQLKAESSPGSCVRITGFTSSDGFPYWVITHQVMRHQHRFILSLVDPNVKALLESISTSGLLSFSMGNDGGDEAVVFCQPFKPSVFTPLLKMCRGNDISAQRESLYEMPLVLDEASKPQTVPSLLEGLAVNHVCVSMLLPKIMDDIVNETLSRAAA